MDGVGALPDGMIGAAATVPGGVIAVSNAAAVPSFLEARWLRAGRATVRSGSLPTPEDAKLDSCGYPGPLVDWPIVLIPACAVDSGNLRPAGYWQTNTGGSSWQYRP